MPQTDVELPELTDLHAISAEQAAEFARTGHAVVRGLASERGLQVQAHGPLRAGDATFHAGWTLHKALPNPTSQMREVMTIIYLADGTRVGDVSSEARRADLAKWFPGLGPGDLADS